MKGRPLSDEHKRNIGNALRGKPLSEETRQKLSESRKGMHFTKEHCKNMSLARMGKRLSPEHCKKISMGNMGKKMSEEAKQKLREAHLGKKNPNYGKHLSDEARKHLASYCGERANNWQGGISYEPYCPKFTKEFKERVRAFFGHICLECGTPQNGEKLHVHHVKFNKETCCDDSIPLFVPLCRPCHAKTQGKREYWKQHFAEIIEKYYQGKCYFTKEEMIQYGIS